MLEDYAVSGRLPMHMPGHKRNAAMLGDAHRYDITEIDGFDDLHNPSGTIAELTRLSAQLWHAQDAMLSVNGSTGLILSSILACAAGHSKILIASNCHISVWHAIELAGLTPVTIMPRMSGKYPFALGLSPEDVSRAISDTPDAAALVYTSPTYEGVISDSADIKDIADRAGIPVILDSAHGAHLGLSDLLPSDGSADIVIKSVHKTLSAPTQTAVLLSYSDRIPMRSIAHYMNVTETSSPSYVLMGGMSRCIYDLYDHGIGDFPEQILRARDVLKRLKHLDLFPSDDPSKFVIITPDGMTGPELAGRMRELHNIEPEAVFPRHVIFMTGTGDTSGSLSRLTAALIEEDRLIMFDKASEVSLPAVSSSGIEDLNFVMSIGDAVKAELTETPITEAEGKICGEYVFAYPPGIPLMVPGAVITESAVRYLKTIAGYGIVPVREPAAPWDGTVFTVDT